MSSDTCSVLVLSRYETLGASSRVRMFSYIPWLRRHGFNVDVQCLFSDEYLSRKYSGERGVASEIAYAYLKRVRAIFGRKTPQLVWLEKELWPYIPAVVEVPFLSRHCCIVDIDDAVFHQYDLHRSALVRNILGRKLDSIFRYSSLVTAGNSYLADRAIDAKAPRVEVLPTVVDLDQYKSIEHPRHGAFTVGWIGSPATQKFLLPLVEMLKETLDIAGSRFVTIGARSAGRWFDSHEEWEWCVDDEARQIAELDVGVMPLPDRPFERGKCGYKLIQYMAAGIPVIASPVGANVEIVRHGVNGFLAETREEWKAALLALRKDRDLRHRMGMAGRELVRQQYCLAATAPKVAGWFSDIARTDRCRRG